jgi:hypothetical protein
MPFPDSQGRDSQSLSRSRIASRNHCAQTALCRTPRQLGASTGCDDRLVRVAPRP